ncbi:hypothetical protein M0C34_09975 [Agarivorans sp. TSD2052]|uniref:hypothetical protein n=1 Tax=Agarivorans sp. TSD2052 TaxID=2937286 RepID=UPI00200C8DBB|nr:hypothetical protein [Agarivorans sp. TSD2052]UPW20554.1 hypothetical protein M0C34_09975 [Agarivorans sp. TSD2052]
MMSKLTVLAIFCCLALVFVPTGLYTYKFGIGLWNSHEDWARMGGFFGGVVGPLITGFSLIFLGLQLKEQLVQRKMELIDKKSSHYEKDISALIPKLALSLENVKFKGGLKFTNLKYEIHEKAGECEKANQLVEEFVESFFQIFNIWASIDNNYRELARIDYQRYRALTFYILIECELEDLYHLNLLTNRFEKIEEVLCTQL